MFLLYFLIHYWTNNLNASKDRPPSLQGADLALRNSGFDSRDVWNRFLTHLEHESIRSTRIASITQRKVYNTYVYYLIPSLPNF